MKFYIIIPAHNEANYIGLTLQSIANQTLLPKKVIVVNDNSTDEMQSIVETFQKKHDWLELINTTSSNKHLPGSKIINAFYKGFETLNEDYDVICKFDADLIFPDNYLETLALHFNKNKTAGMVAGYCYTEENNTWTREKITGKDHIRGALKAYRKACFLEIGKLKTAMGWDTIDELLAQFYNWKIILDDNLKVKHLKPTGSTYNATAKLLPGKALYSMRMGLVLTCILGLNHAIKRKRLNVISNYIKGYLKAKKDNIEPFITVEQGRFVRKKRWIGFKKKLGL